MKFKRIKNWNELLKHPVLFCPSFYFDLCYILVTELLTKTKIASRGKKTRTFLRIHKKKRERKLERDSLLPLTFLSLWESSLCWQEMDAWKQLLLQWRDSFNAAGCWYGGVLLSFALNWQLKQLFIVIKKITGVILKWLSLRVFRQRNSCDLFNLLDDYWSGLARFVSMTFILWDLHFLTATC